MGQSERRMKQNRRRNRLILSSSITKPRFCSANKIRHPEKAGRTIRKAHAPTNRTAGRRALSARGETSQRIFINKAARAATAANNAQAERAPTRLLAPSRTVWSSSCVPRLGLLWQLAVMPTGTRLRFARPALCLGGPCRVLAAWPCRPLGAGGEMRGFGA